MVYFSIKNKDLNYIVNISEKLKNFYTNQNIKFSSSEIEQSHDGQWYITIAREGDINAFNI